MQTPAIEFRSYASQVQSHTHSFVQMVLPVHGTLEIDIAGFGGFVGNGHMAVIGAGDRHAFASPLQKNRFLVVDLPAADIAMLDPLAARRFVALGPAQMHLVKYIEQVMDHPRDRNTLTAHRLSGWLDLFLGNSEFMAREPWRRSLARAMSFIESSYDRRISVADIARAASVGTTQLHELFARQSDTSPHAYLVGVRLRKAATLLANSRFSIADIAIRTGHADQSVLTRRMRESYGVTPAAYRRAHHQRRDPGVVFAQESEGLGKKRRSH